MKQILLLLLFSFCRWETNSEMASGWPKVTLLSAECQVVRSIQTLVCPSPEPTLHFSTLYGNQVVSDRFFWRNVSWSHQSWSYSQATSPLPIFLLKLISLAPWFPWIQTFPIRNIIKSSSVKITMFTKLSQNQPPVVLHESNLTQSVSWNIPHISSSLEGQEFSLCHEGDEPD